MAKAFGLVVLCFFLWQANGFQINPSKNILPNLIPESSLEVPKEIDLPEELSRFECGWNNNLYPNPENCSTFIQCSNGQPYLMLCPGKLHFSNETKRCEEQCAAFCDQTLSCRCNWQTCGLDKSCWDTPVKGPCKAVITRFFFNKRSGRCEKFAYGGCKGNKNNFRTKEECESKCIRRKTLEPLPSCSVDGRYPYPGSCSSYIKCRNQEAYIMDCPDGQHFSKETQQCDDKCQAQCDASLACKCGWPSCERAIPTSFKCELDGLFPHPEHCGSFIQCSNGNPFLMQCPSTLHFSNITKRCETKCDAQCDRTLACKCKWPSCSSEGVCFLPFKTGPCKSQLERYHFDKRSGECKPFIYGGCRGNENNFYSKSECEQRCSTSYLNVCELPSEKGFCDGKFLKYYFDYEQGKCKQFIYSGCGGNKNKFSSRQECEQSCLREVQVEAQPENFPEEKHETTCAVDGKYPDPSNCYRFIQCQKGKPILGICFREGFHYNAQTEKCDTFCNAHCNQSMACGCGWSTCQKDDEFKTFTCEEDGLFQHPKNCSSYIQCSNGRSYVMPCPYGLHFSAKTQRCERPCNAFCDKKIACRCKWPTSGRTRIDEAIFQEYYDLAPQQRYADEHQHQFADRQEQQYADRQGQQFALRQEQNNAERQERNNAERQEQQYAERQDEQYAERQGEQYADSQGQQLAERQEQSHAERQGQQYAERQGLQNAERQRQQYAKRQGQQYNVEQTERAFEEEQYAAGQNEQEATLQYISRLYHKLVPGQVEQRSAIEQPSPFANEQTQEYASRAVEHKTIGQAERQAIAYNSEELECEEDGKYPDPKNCSRFYRCTNQVAINEPCPSGLHFNPVMKTCQLACKARCEKALACECQWEDCDDSVCEMEKEEGNCDGTFERFFYNSQSGKCEEFKYSGCQGNQNNFESKMECMNKCYSGPKIAHSETRFIDLFCEEDGLYPNIFNCGSYIQCQSGKGRIMSCPEGHFNSETERCEPPCQARCDFSLEKSLPEPEIFCVADGLYPNVYVCNSYIQCQKGMGRVRTCPKGHFNPKTKRCEPPCKARCDLSLACYCKWPECYGTPEVKPSMAPLYCQMEKDQGPCEGFYQRYFYNNATGRCEQFQYGGCQGNQNNFLSESECITSCVPDKLEAPSAEISLIDFQCPTPNGQFPHPNHCEAFFQCIDNQPEVGLCPPDKSFDARRLECLPIEEAYCF